jgi:diacylglycerol kinase family enzyme
VLTGERHGLVGVVVVALFVASGALARFALAPTSAPGVVVVAARHPVLLVNPKSGDGKAGRFGLVDEARARGIETVVLGPGDDLLALARDAIARGADVIGMAGGDGSQALVASVAMEHDVAHVCIPSGTRNHFALDIGLDRDDVIGALDAFLDGAHERRIDLAVVGDRVFVNNVSLGVYAAIVQSPEYRGAKRQTAEAMLPDLLGAGAPRSPLRFTTPQGAQPTSVPLVLVSNNPYLLTKVGGFGTRPRLDTGMLGVTALEIEGAADVAAFVAAEMTGRAARFRGLHQWAAPEFVVDADAPVEAGVDGEALMLDPPLRFRALPAALRIRVPPHAPGWSPAAVRDRTLPSTVAALVSTVGARR